MIGQGLKYETTTAFEKIASLKGDVRIIQGGKGSSKTISILQIFILMLISDRQNLIMSVVAQSLPNLKSGAMRDFEKILKSWGLYDKIKHNKSDRTYQYGTNIVEFFSVDGEGSRLGSRRTHLYINEADFIKFSTYIELYSRTFGFTIMDFNPRRKFWAHKELVGQPDVDYLILNYSHNEFIPVKEKKAIMWFKKKADEGSKYFLNKWRVLGLGLLGITEGLIFENWIEGKYVPKDAKYLGAAIDWGFTNDPTTLVKFYRYDSKIYVEQSLYRREMLNSKIAAHIKRDSQVMENIIIADSAEPKSIAELKSYGIKITKAKDKKIMSGIAIMQEFDFVIVGKEAVEEWSNYSMKYNKAGENLGIPVDDWNHTIDPTRYFVVDRLSKSATSGNVLKFLK